METTYKIEITKNADTWTCSLLKLIDLKGIDGWEFEDEVKANSYSDLQTEIGSAGFFEKINNNK